LNGNNSFKEAVMNVIRNDYLQEVILSKTVFVSAFIPVSYSASDLFERTILKIDDKRREID